MRYRIATGLTAAVMALGYPGGYAQAARSVTASGEGEAVTETETVLNKPEPLFPVKCDVHPWMRSYVAVMTHPFFAVTGKDGKFAIEGLPAGSWQVQVTTPDGVSWTGTATMLPGQVTRLQLD